MNIDQRLHEAADHLRAALLEIPVSDPPQRPTHHPRSRVVLTALGVGLVCALAAGLLAVAANDDDLTETTSDTTTEGGPVPSEATSTTTFPADGATRALLEKAEADPQDYRAPAHPTLSVSPSDGLVDGQVVAVLGEGLPPGEEIGIAACEPWDGAASTDPQCLYTSSGVGTVDAQGRLWLPDYKLAALEPVIGFDCAQPPGCELAWYVGVGEPPRVTAPIRVIA